MITVNIIQKFDLFKPLKQKEKELINYSLTSYVGFDFVKIGNTDIEVKIE